MDLAAKEAMGRLRGRVRHLGVLWPLVVAVRPVRDIGELDGLHRALGVSRVGDSCLLSYYSRGQRGGRMEKTSILGTQ